MANYFVSDARGNNSTGTGAATNPWKTIGKAIGASPAITLSGSGDTLYVEPGLYRETVAFSLTPSSGSPFAIVGDCDGAGFLAGGYSTPATGVVDWRGWTDDVTVASTSVACLTLSSKPYVTIRNLKILGTGLFTGGCISVFGTSTNFTAQDCVFISHSNAQAVLLAMTFAAGTWNMLIDRCDVIFGTISGLGIQVQTNTTQYSIGVTVRNCRFMGRGECVAMTTSGGTGTALATGVTFQNCLSMFGNSGFKVYTGNSVTMTTPIGIYGCATVFCSGGVFCQNSSQVVLDYNAHSSTTTTFNCSEGAHSKSIVSPALDLGDARLTGLPYRPWAEPAFISAFVGMVSGGSPPSVDILNRPRPAGYASLGATAGPLERHNTARKESTTTVSGVGIALDGPGDHVFQYAVDAVSTTISVQVRYDTNHGATTKPDVKMLACPEIGVAAQTLTMSVGVNTWETLTFSSFTPTAKGAVKIQFLPHPAAANGIMFMDSFT